MRSEPNHYHVPILLAKPANGLCREGEKGLSLCGSLVLRLAVVLSKDSHSFLNLVV